MLKIGDIVSDSLGEDAEVQYGGSRKMPRSAAVEQSRPRSVQVFTGRVAALGIAGGLATGLALAATLIAIAPETSEFEMQQVASDEVATASQSLLASAAPALVEEAKSCRRPLAYVVIRGTEQGGGTVRLRVGTYVSPPIRLGPNPARIALPFPEPYASGRGQITVENKSAGVELFLVPGTKLPPGPGVTVLNVHWIPKASC